MCCPFTKVFDAFRDFRHSITDVKTNLNDIKAILNGTLTITQDFEDVTGEFKNVVEFYSNESKNALRDQFFSTMTDAGKEELRHKDFLKFFKTKFEEEVNELIETHCSKYARISILNVVNHMRDFVMDLLDDINDEEETLNIFMLEDLELYFEESFEMYKRDNVMNDDPTNDHAYIAAFCDKQKIIIELEELIVSHLDNTQQSDYPHYNDLKSRQVKYRDRESRVRKLRQYLKEKIRIRKIGKLYREEISLQINMDLKKAAVKVNECEEHVSEYCEGITTVLKQLPKHRFTEVLDQERVIDMRILLKNLMQSSQSSVSPHQVHHEEPCTYMSESTLNGMRDNVCGSKHENLNNLPLEEVKKVKIDVGDNKEITANDVVQFLKRQMVKFDENNDLQRVLQTGQKLIKRSNIFKCILKKRHTLDMCQYDGVVTPLQPIVNVDKQCDNVGTALTTYLQPTMDLDNQCNEIDKAFIQCLHSTTDLNNQYENIDTSLSTCFKPKILKNIIIIDTKMILDDLEIVAEPIFDSLSEVSTKYAIKLVDNSHVIASRVIDVMSSIDAVLHEHEMNVDTNENIFLEKFFQLLDCELEEDHARALKSVLYALTYTETNRMYFLERLQQLLPSMVTSHFHGNSDDEGKMFLEAVMCTLKRVMH